MTASLSKSATWG